MDALGNRLIKSILSTKDLIKVSREGITVDDIFDEARTAFDWIHDYVSTYKEFPSESVVEEKTSCTLPTEVDNLEYICNELIKRSTAKKLRPVLENIIKKIDDREPEAALELMSVAGSSLRRSKLVAVSDFKKDSASRYDEYLRTKVDVKLVGIETPWKFLNKKIACWANGQLHVIVAHSGVGKTWEACFIAEDAYEKGNRVLVVSQEMKKNRVQRRLDCIRYKLPYGRFRDGTLDVEIEEEWKEKIEKYSKTDKGEIFVVDKEQVKCTYDIELLVNELKPNMVIIDSAYRLEANKQKGDRWETNYKVVKELQIAAEQSNIPWIATSQLWEETSGKIKKTTTSVIKYGKEWLIDPDVVISLHQDEDLRIIHRMLFKVVKIRDGDGVFSEHYVNCDKNTMDFTEVGDEKETSTWSSSDPGEIAVKY